MTIVRVNDLGFRRRTRDDVSIVQTTDLGAAQAEESGENLIGVLAQARRWGGVQVFAGREEQGGAWHAITPDTGLPLLGE